jgi:signal peptidase I
MTFSGYSIAIILLLFSGLSFGGVVKARIVLTGSMAPAINAGDIIITTPITRKEPQIGDVVAYQAKRFNGEYLGCCHLCNPIPGKYLDS